MPIALPVQQPTIGERATAVSAVRPVFRLITDSHIEKINRLMLCYFDDDRDAALKWLRKNWNAEEPRQLATGARAAHVIRVLEYMLHRMGRKA